MQRPPPEDAVAALRAQRLATGMALPCQRPMTVADLPRVLAVEVMAYGHPWSHGNFIDALAAGYQAELKLDEAGAIVGYWLVMPGFDESHLLNLTVAPARQRQGHGRAMLDGLVARCRERGDRMLWLEVRAGNAAAAALYRRSGFVEVNRRRGYYPAGTQREDAVVMCLTLDASAEPRDALV